MESLLTKGISDVRRQEFPAGRNRYVGVFSPISEGEFAPLAEVMQPLFQGAGFAPRILIREPGDSPTYTEVKLSHTGAIAGLAFALPLYDTEMKRIVTAPELANFEELCNKVADAITNQLMPKGWFSKRRSSSSIMAKPIFVNFNMPKETALVVAAANGKFVAELPRYEKTVRIDIENVDADVDEMGEFLDFCGFPESERPGVWHHKETGVVATKKDNSLILAIVSVPRTIAPDIIYNNLTEVARRCTLEFGGSIKADNQRAAQTMVGWRNVLARVNMVPGDDESREYFPDPLAPH